MLALHAMGTGIEAVELIELASPTLPAPKLLAVINPADILTLEGKYGVKPEPPFVPGAECLARVSSVGEAVKGLAIGDLVIPFGGSSWCTQMLCHAGAVVKVSETSDLHQAAMLKANPATALAMLEDIVALEPGDWVVQNAGNSAVGLNVVKIARALGLKTVSIIRRDEPAKALYDAGADHVLIHPDCTPEALTGITAKLGLDAVGGRATSALVDMLEDGATVANYGLLSGSPCQIEPYDLVFRDIKLQGFWLAKWFETAGRDKIASHYARLSDWLEKGLIGADIERVYPLAEFHEALAHAAKSGRNGKILIEMP